MKGTELRALRLKCVDPDTRQGLTQAQAAARIGVTRNTFARYERNVITIPEPVARLARLTLQTDFDIGDLDDG